MIDCILPHGFGSHRLRPAFYSMTAAVLARVLRELETLLRKKPRGRAHMNLP